MAWTAPRTWVTGETPTAAVFNTHVRDNFLVLDSATAGSILVSDGTAPVFRTVTGEQQNGTSFTFTNSSYLALDSVTGGSAGSAVTRTVTTGTAALVFLRARLSSSSAGGYVYLSYSVSGATTQAAADARSLFLESSNADDFAAFGTFDYTTLTAGSNTFELEARVSAGTATMTHTELVVMAL